MRMPSIERVAEATTPFAELPPRTSEAPRVLVIDDEESLRVALSRFLRSRGYEVTAVSSAFDALAALDRDHCDLALCDVRMPGMTGMELLPVALEKDPELAIVMLTAVNDAPTATEAIARGASDYLVKPIELADLQAAVERALHRRGLLKEQRRVEALIRQEVASRTAQLEEEKGALRALTVGIVQTLINAMEAKDVFLRGRSERIAELAASIATEMQLDVDTVEEMRLAGRLLDIGLIGIKESVLHKPEALSPEEVAHVREHVSIGMQILAPLQHLGTVLEFIHDHHEYYDGGGYPRGRSGQQISLGGRILAAADAFDALTSRRAYREPRNPGEAVGILEQAAGSQLDPVIFRALRNCVLRRRSLTFIE
jgi:putative two-component system response regulator